jgi:hypothetical protein
VHDNGIGRVHEQIETAQAFNVARLLSNRASFLENDLGERGKVVVCRIHSLKTNRGAAAFACDRPQLVIL